MAPGDPVVSTGRGGAGNIGRDPTVYTDGNIVREGPEGQTADAEYSTGRGGAGNIGEERRASLVSSTTATDTRTQPHGDRGRIDETVVPETALHEGHYSEYHTGRGGQGNVHKDKHGGHSSAHAQEHAGDSLKDKVKKTLHLEKDERLIEREESEE